MNSVGFSEQKHTQSHTQWRRVTADHAVEVVIGPGRWVALHVCVFPTPPFSTGSLPAMIKWSVKQGSAHLQRGPFLNVTSFSVSGHGNGSKPAGLIVHLLT